MENPVPKAPLCFVLMPFGRKTDATGRTTDFDAVYREIIAPAVTAVGLEPIRADEERVGGTIHKPMFERLMLCDYAVADITGANPNVYYELGIRHAMRPRSTVILFAEGTTLPFDIALLRGVPYRTDESGVPLEPQSCAAKVTRQLDAARANPHDDSPLFQLLDYMPRFEVDHSKTDTFRDRFDYSRKYKERLADARKQGEAAVKSVVADPALGNLAEVEAGVVVDLFLSLRDVEAHAAMVELYARMPQPLQRTRIIREQLGFALNRIGRFQEAEKVLKEVLQEFGPSSETGGLLGRIYKDRWKIASAGQAAGCAGAAAPRDRDLSRGLSGRLARRVSWDQRRHADGDAGQGRSAGRPRSCRSCATRRRRKRGAARTIGTMRRCSNSRCSGATSTTSSSSSARYWRSSTTIRRPGISRRRRSSFS